MVSSNNNITETPRLGNHDHDHVHSFTYIRRPETSQLGTPLLITMQRKKIRIIGLICGRTVSYKFRDPGETDRHIKRDSLFYRETSTKNKECGMHLSYEKRNNRSGL